VRPLADGALREQVARLLSNWELDDPNPEGYRELLQRLAAAPARAVPDAVGGASEEETLRLVEIGLEIDEYGTLVERAIDQLVEAGKFRSLIAVVEAAPDSGCAAVAMVRAQLAAPASMASLVTREPLDAKALDQLFPWITLDGYQVLLDALCASTNRSTRRRLLDRLAATDLDVVPLLIARLDGEHWYVVRNMLVLLQRVKGLPPDFAALGWADHPDGRVRVEALRLALTRTKERDLAIARALEDGDTRILRLGLSAVEHDCPARTAPRVVQAALDVTLVEEVRVLAAHTLGRCRDPLARNALLQLVDGGRTLLGRPRLAAPLSEGWTTDPAAASMLDLAVASRDPALRQAAALTGAR
jgi:hypothetical protein